MEERKYIVANTTKFDILLKELNVIVPARAAVNLFELAPELNAEMIKREEAVGILGLRLKQGMLVGVQTNEITPQRVSSIPKKLASEKVKPKKTVISKTSSKSKKASEKSFERTRKGLHRINNEKTMMEKNGGGIVTVAAVEEDNLDDAD